MCLCRTDGETEKFGRETQKREGGNIEKKKCKRRLRRKEEGSDL